MNVKAILFDLIGTTVIEKDSNTILNCLKQAFELYGIEADEALLKNNRGKDKLEMIKIVLKENHCQSSLEIPIYKAFKQNVNSNIDNFVAADNAEKVFVALRSRHIKIGMGSGMPRAQFNKLFEHLKWKEKDFDYIGISSELGKARPNPIMVLDILKTLNIEKNELLKVGDTVADVEEGKNAGVKTIAIHSGTQPIASLLQSNPDYLIENLEDVIAIVNDLQPTQ